MPNFISSKTDYGAIAANAFAAGYPIGADAYQKDKAQQIQQAIITGQMKQKDDEFNAELARKKAADAAMAQYRARLGDQADERTKIEHQNADTNTQRQADTFNNNLTKNQQSQQKLDDLTKNRATQTEWVKANRPQDLEYFNAFGKLPGHDGAGFQTDPQTHALEQARKDVENEWLKGAKALKDHQSTDSAGLDASDSVQGAKAGHEKEYAAIKHQMDIYAAQHKILTDSLYRQHMKVAGVPVEGDPFGVGNANPNQSPLGPGAQPANGPAVAIPKAPGFQQSGNPHVAPGTGHTPAMQQAPQPGAGGGPAGWHPAAGNDVGIPQGPTGMGGYGPVTPAAQPAAPVITPEQKVAMVNAVAAEKGVNPDSIKMLPPASKLAVQTLVGNLRKQISDPNKLASEITRQLILAGFDPMKPPVDNAAMQPLPMK